MNKHRIEATTLGDLLLKAADRYPDNDAIVFPDRRYSYAELVEASYRRARSLIALGVERGDHVGILMPNCMDYVELIFGCALAGAVAIPINARFKAYEMGYVIENADIKALFTNDLISEYADFAQVLNDAFPDLKDQADPFNLTLKGAPLLKSVVMMGESTPPGFMAESDFDALEARATDDMVEDRRIGVALRDPCMMMYTSGTTANPKGCPITNEMLVRNGINMNRERYFLTPEDRFWAALPMFHMASILPMVAIFDAGATMLTMTHVDFGEVLKMLEAERCTILFAAFPTVTAGIVNHPDFKTRDLSRIRRVNSISPPDVQRQFQAAFPNAPLTAAFGMTEVGGVICFGHPDDPLETRMHACGRPFPGLEIKVVDPETGEELPPGEKGELIARGYARFDGYYKDPAKTAEAIRDGWFHTGDLGAVDENGQVYFHGRLKDMLKVGGENVAAVEIEGYLGRHPAVKMAQVIGIPDPRLEEVAAAFIELKPGASATEQELIDFCKGKIASFKVPRYVRFVTEWPMSSTKIQKFKLKEDFLAELQAAE